MTSYPAGGDFHNLRTSFFQTGKAACQNYGGSCTGTFAYACGADDWVISQNMGGCDVSIGSNDFFNNAIIMSDGESNNRINVPSPKLSNIVDTCSWKVKCNNITPQGYNIYPSKNVNEIKLLNVPSGDYKLKYYSSDLSKNLEVLKDSLITVDALVPELRDFNENIVEFEIYNDVWRSNIEMSYNLVEEHGFANCEAVLESSSGFSYGSNSIGDAFVQNYTYLSDGLYFWSLSCYDIYNNKAIYTKEILLNADKSIANLTPNLEVFNVTSVDLKIETQSAASCKFSVDTPTSNYPSDYPNSFITNDYLVHTSTINDLDENMIHVVYVACEFIDSDKITQNNPGDLMIFSIDKSSPSSVVRRVLNNELYDPILWTDYEELYFDCNDSNPNLEFYLGETLIPLYSGVQHINYCLSSSNGISTIPPVDCSISTALEGSSIIITNSTIQEYGGYVDLYYSCVDNHNNREDWNSIPILVRDVNFDNPVIRIYDPILGEYYS